MHIRFSRKGQGAVEAIRSFSRFDLEVTERSVQISTGIIGWFGCKLTGLRFRT